MKGIEMTRLDPEDPQDPEADERAVLFDRGDLFRVAGHRLAQLRPRKRALRARGSETVYALLYVRPMPALLGSRVRWRGILAAHQSARGANRNLLRCEAQNWFADNVSYYAAVVPWSA